MNLNTATCKIATPPSLSVVGASFDDLTDLSGI